MRLAALWHCTVREAQARIDSAEFAEWCAFYLIEPWGGSADDARIGMLCSMGAGVAGVKLEPSDIFPRLTEDGEPVNSQHQNPQLEAVAAVQLAVLSANAKSR